MANTPTPGSTPTPAYWASRIEAARKAGTYADREMRRLDAALERATFAAEVGR